MIVKKIILSILTFILFFLAAFYILTFFISQGKNAEPSNQINQEDPLPKIKEHVYLNDLGKIRENFISEEKSFMEIDLSEMKIKNFKEGLLTEEFPIFTRGVPDRWGGTPLGVYEIISRNPLAYSTLADSYMPWSLHVYGKYYIHGDNYYSGGRPETLPITGGCLRLHNQDAKEVYNLAKIGVPVLATDKGYENDGYEYPLKRLTEFPELSSPNYLVGDLDSGLILAEKNYQNQVPIASITKLMTAIIVAEIVDLRKSIYVSSEMLETPQDTEGLTAGKTFQAVELFYPLLIESSNDAAEVLSGFLGRTWTINLMNKKAEAILMKDTEFVDPSGLSPQNVSTCEDIFNLTRYILNSRPMFWEIGSGREVWTFSIPIRFQNLENKNIFFEDPNFIGGKTGFISASQSTGTFVFRFPLEDGSERRIAIIGLGAEAVNGFPVNLEDDVKKIIDWLNENYF